MKTERKGPASKAKARPASKPATRHTSGPKPAQSPKSPSMAPKSGSPRTAQRPGAPRAKNQGPQEVKRPVEQNPARTTAGTTSSRRKGNTTPHSRPDHSPSRSRKESSVPRAQKDSTAPRHRKANEGDRLQKILAHAGIASRRACEQLILEGHVQINGTTVTELGAKANPKKDDITVDLVPIRREAPVYILINKPKGYVTTVKDDQGRPTVMALMHGIQERVYPVGRLDFQSEGLLLMTNDGDMAQRLTSPEFHIPKIYLVKVHRMPPQALLDEMRSGYKLDGRKLRPCHIEFFDRQENPWLKITLTEGKNQQIRKMFAAVGHPVHKLRRIQFGPLDDPGLKPGQWRYLTAAELTALKNL